MRKPTQKTHHYAQANTKNTPLCTSQHKKHTTMGKPTQKTHHYAQANTKTHHYAQANTNNVIRCLRFNYFPFVELDSLT
jgi:hypothetical protein